MVKLENTKDQNVARDKVLNSPLKELVHHTWRYFDEKITSPVSLKEEDIVRYVLWSIENIKGGEDGPTQSSQDLRRCIVCLFRESNYPSEIVELLSNIICSYVLVCLDCASLYSYRADIYRLGVIAQESIKEDYKQKVLECKEKIKCWILQSGLSSDLGKCCTEHLLSDEFLTEDDAEWCKNDSSLSTSLAGEDDNQTVQNNLQASAFSQYIMLTKEVDIIIKCLHQLVDSQNSPKNQLAPIKAAIEYNPHLINSNLPLAVFNSEFNLNIAKSTYGNWIRGHHGSKYREDELKVYWDIFKHEITPQIVKSAL